MDTIRKAYISMLTESDARSALSDYAADSGINTALRAGSDKYNSIVSQIESLAKPTNHDMVLYRSLYGGHDQDHMIQNTKVGDLLLDNGFVSTSKSLAGISAVNRGMEDFGGEPKHLLHIVVPKGTKVIDVNSHLGNHYHHSQDEVILPTKSKMIKTHDYKENNITHHHFRIM